VSAFAEAGDDKAAKAFSHVTLTGAAVAQGRWKAWTDTSADGFHANWNPDIDGYQFRQQFGLDYRFPNGWVAGVGIGVSAFDNDFENSGSLSGNSYWIEPYFGMDVGGWLVALQGAYTYSDYRTFDTGLGLSDSAHGNRLSGSLTVSRQYDFPSGFYVAPEVSISAGTEDISKLRNLGGGPVSVRNASFFSTNFGGEFGYHLPHGGRVYGLALAEYTDTSGDGAETYLSTGYQASRWSATLGGGFDATFAGRFHAGLEGRVRGVGSDTLIYGASARFSVSF
jgi:hypothetical protein